MPETEPRGSKNSSEGSTSCFTGDAEATWALVAWPGLVLVGGEEALGAEAVGVSPPL